MLYLLAALVPALCTLFMGVYAAWLIPLFVAAIIAYQGVNSYGMTDLGKVIFAVMIAGFFGQFYVISQGLVWGTVGVSAVLITVSFLWGKHS